jgi:hypothetical protein
MKKSRSFGDWGGRMARWTLLLLDTLALVCLAHAAEPASGNWAYWPSAGATWFVGAYEAERAALGGSAHIVGAADGSDRAIGDLGGEASGRRAVTLMNTGDSVSFTVLPASAGANAIVIRYSIPDAANGGGQSQVMDLTIAGARGAPRLNATLTLTSRYAWLYGGVEDGTQLYNVSANANRFGRPGEPKGPTHLYDEIQFKLKESLRSGDSVKLTKVENDLGPITIDFIELEAVPGPLPQPSGYLSITNPSCGAIPTDTHGTGEAFDGDDDSSYGSVFHAVIGINPFNPSALTQEKDYYSTDPLLDTLLDARPNAIAGGLSMWELADHNFQSLQKCIDLVGASGGAYRGVWIPAGRFYARGFLLLPDNLQIRGAGTWYSKFAAVDTMAPVPVTFNGVTGIASESGDLVFASGANGSDSVALSDFSMFGNVTQRDSVDTRSPHAVTGTFTNSHFNALWIEHYVVGFTIRGNSSRDLVTNSRVRNTLADGFDLIGSPVGSLISNCHARSNGDDGFAIWSQSTDPTKLSTNNKVSDSLAQLQWIGGGFSIYGGAHNSIESNEAFDTLRNACVQVSTNFVPSGLPLSVTMSASAADMNLYRCGGNGFNQQFGALLVGVEFESLDGIVLRNINIYDPSYKGIDLRQIGGAVPGTFSNVTFNHVQVYAPPVCSAVGTFTKGNAQFNDVCVCQGVNHVASVCNVANGSIPTFQVIPNICSQLICRRPVILAPSGLSLRDPPEE